MCTDEQKALLVKFNTAYLLAKKERPFSDILELQKKNGVQNISKAYFTDRKCLEYICKSIKSELAHDLI